MDIKQFIFGKQLERIKTAHYNKSTQKWLPIADIAHGMVITKDNRYIKILEVMPVNFELKSPLERQNIIYYYSSYLKIAPDNLQILIITQKADIDGYINRMQGFYESEPNSSCRVMIEDNINEVAYLAANEAVTRRFFLVFCHEPRMKTRGDSLLAIGERLTEEEQTARRYLGMCGLEVLYPNYSDNFILELLYSLINKRVSAHTKLPEGVFSVNGKVFGVMDDEIDTIGGGINDEQGI